MFNPVISKSHYNVADRENKFQQILSPIPVDEGVWIHQDAWFHIANLQAGKSLTYTIKKTGNGLYIFVIKGKLTVDNQELELRDGLGITNFDTINFLAIQDSELLIMEIPMQQ